MDLSMNWVDVEIEEVKINFEPIGGTSKFYYISGNINVRYENTSNFWLETGNITIYDMEDGSEEVLDITIYTSDVRISYIVSELNRYIQYGYYHDNICEKIREYYNSSSKSEYY